MNEGGTYKIFVPPLPTTFIFKTSLRKCYRNAENLEGNTPWGKNCHKKFTVKATNLKPLNLLRHRKKLQEMYKRLSPFTFFEFFKIWVSGFRTQTFRNSQNESEDWFEESIDGWLHTPSRSQPYAIDLNYTGVCPIVRLFNKQKQQEWIY